MPEPVYFRPPHGLVGDVIPFVKGDEAWLYFLLDERLGQRHGTGWALVRTRDFVEFEFDGMSLAPGSPSDLDLNAYTGSIVEAGGVTYAFYTGQNPDVLSDDGTTPLQQIARATSVDGGLTWQRDSSSAFPAFASYEPGDWRDPYVFRVQGEDQWRMLITARHSAGPQRRRGLIAQATSSDLTTWSAATPFWDPRRYIAHECPEVFKWGDWWYLVFSEFSERFCTRYRVSDSVDGPWRVPERDSLDGRGFYAAKSLELNGRRFFIGWIPTRAGEHDDGPWDWAGDMAVLEAVQTETGDLHFRVPAEVRTSFTSEFGLSWIDPARAAAGPVPAREPLRLSAPDGYAVTVSTGELPDQFRARIRFTHDDLPRECGVLLRCSTDGDAGYVLRFEPAMGRLVFDRWPRRRTGPMQWEISGDVPHIVELERPCAITPGPHELDVIVDGSAFTAVLDGAVSMSGRMYGHVSGHLGVFVGEGETTINEVEVWTRPD